MDAITNFFIDMLTFFRSFLGNYGLAIILLTVCVELVTLPLNIKQTQQTIRMNKIQPELKALEQKYAKKHPEKYNREVQRLYRENNINVMMGCLPTLIQLPFLFCLYYALRDSNFGEGFLFIKDLGANPVGLEAYILCILAAGSTFLVSKLSSTGSSSNPGSMGTSMLIVMPLMMGWFAFQVSAGVSLYWILRNIFAIIKQLVMVQLPKLKENRAAKQENN